MKDKLSGKTQERIIGFAVKLYRMMVKDDTT